MLVENSLKKAKFLLFVLYLFRCRTSIINHQTKIFLPLVLSAVANSAVYSQQTATYYTPPPVNNFSSSRVFRQEIARFEVTVSRDGKPALPLTQVPRIEEGDILRVKLLEEAVGGTKPDQSNFDWTLAVAFINPNRNDSDPRSVTEEIRFRDKGWYKEHVFRVPYDSQPIIFLYTKPKYRSKISNLINKNPEDIRKLGEKTIEIAGAYAQIGSFLTELQDVINRTRYNSYNGYGNSYGGYNNNYGSSYGNSNYYNSYGNSAYRNLNQFTPAFNNSQFVEQTVERVAKSFNIQLPQCWRPNNSYGSYGSYSTSSSYNSNYGATGSYGSGYGTSQDLVGRMQCIAQSVRVEDLDISLSRMIQQGGVMVAAQIAQKYPQIAYWINLAAAAMDLIVKITRKAALKIVPTIVSASDSSAGYNSGYQANYSAGYNSSQTVSNSYTQTYPLSNQSSPSLKISVYAENQPGDDKFVTAYPVIVHKWQPEPDPERLALSAPVPLESCLHAGQNILKNTDLSQDWLNDAFTRNFKLVVSSPNGFFKEFPLRKNAGLLGWDLNLTREDLAAFPKIGMTVDAEITGTRGFTELKSPKFPLPVSATAKWEVTADSQKNFTIGGKRSVAVINTLGNCLCIQSVIYKPSFGGQFVFEANGRETGLQFSPDGREAWFSIDATEFKSGAGTLDLITYGGEKTTLNLKAYPLLPKIADTRIAKGDREAILTGERLEQVQFVYINGIKAKVMPGSDPKERVAVFEDLYARQTSETIALEMLLEEDRRVKVPETFKTSIARPMLVAAADKELDGDYVIAAPPLSAAKTAADESAKSSDPVVVKEDKPVNNIKNMPPKPQIDLTNLPVIPINATGVSVHVKNALTDYDFKAENIQIEARLEKGEANLSELVKSGFEVLDWRNMHVNFDLDPRLQKLLGGRRLQFRLKDKARGNSDWYTIRQTFVRIPRIDKITCPNDVSGTCVIKGEGIDYIAQVSVDGGGSWSPADASGVIAKVAPDGSKTAAIPYLANKKLLRIKLKDYVKTDGLSIAGYEFSKTTNGVSRSYK